MNSLQHLLYWLFEAKTSGLLPLPPDDRDYNVGVFGWTGYTPKSTRKEIATVSVKDQRSFNTCGWVSSLAGKEVDEKVVLNERTTVTYAAKNSLLSGNGYSNLRDNQKVLNNFGAGEGDGTPTLSWDKYVSFNLDTIKDIASGHKTKTYWAVSSRDDIMKLLDDGRPVTAGMDWYTGFNQGGGFKTPWIISKAVGYIVGGHAILIIGYDTDQDVYIVQNSYSNQWGDKGKFYVKRSYLEAEIKKYGAYTNLDIDQPVVDILTQYFAQNVKGDKSPGIYFIYGGAKHAYPDEDTWMSFDAEKDGFTVVRQDDLDKVPEGEPMRKEAGQNWELIQKIKKPYQWWNIFKNKR